MRSPKINFTLIIIIFLTFSLLYGSNNESTDNQYLNSKLNNNKENFSYSNALINFEIDEIGNYDCEFTLDFIGDSEMNKSLSGIFVLNIKNISNFQLFIGDSNSVDALPNNVTSVNESLYWNFSYFKDFQVGIKYSITGYFSGSFINENSIYNYNFKIDWGVLIGGEQNTIIKYNKNYFTLGQPVHPDYYQHLSTNPAYIERISWTEHNVNGLDINFKLIPMNIPDINNFLIIDETSWNTSIGNLKVFTLKNEGSFTINGFILEDPGLESNVSKFTLKPNETLEFSIKTLTEVSESSLSVEILTLEFGNQHLLITVNITENSNDLTFLFVLLFALASFSLASLVFIQREKINYYIRNFLVKYNSETYAAISEAEVEDVPDFNGEGDWDIIEDNWKNILSAKEMNVVKILYLEGEMDQTSISEALEMTKMSVSRIITKLENKNILSRHKNGMYNIIKLNTDKLL